MTAKRVLHLASSLRKFAPARGCKLKVVATLSGKAERGALSRTALVRWLMQATRNVRGRPARTLLGELDQLHKLPHSVQAQQRQEPAVQSRRRVVLPLTRKFEKAHGFTRNSVHLPRDPTHRAYCDSFDDGIVDSGAGDGVVMGVESFGR